jgi:hypothetical protein
MDLLSMALFAGSALLAQITARQTGDIAPFAAEPYRGVPLGVEAAWPAFLEIDAHAKRS